MGKIYTSYDEYIQDAYEEQIDKYIMELKETITQDWWQWLDWDQRRLCVVSKPQYTFRARLCKKYHLKLKSV